VKIFQSHCRSQWSWGWSDNFKKDIKNLRGLKIYYLVSPLRALKLLILYENRQNDVGTTYSKLSFKSVGQPFYWLMEKYNTMELQWISMALPKFQTMFLIQHLKANCCDHFGHYSACLPWEPILPHWARFNMQHGCVLRQLGMFVWSHRR
jgi:hypothetical protein